MAQRLPESWKLIFGKTKHTNPEMNFYGFYFPIVNYDQFMFAGCTLIMDRHDKSSTLLERSIAVKLWVLLTIRLSLLIEQEWKDYSYALRYENNQVSSSIWTKKVIVFGSYS